MILSVLVILVCSSVSLQINGKDVICDETHHIRMLTAEDIRSKMPETETFTDLQLCNLGWAIAVNMDGSSTLGKGEYVRVICRIGEPDSKPETPK